MGTESPIQKPEWHKATHQTQGANGVPFKHRREGFCSTAQAGGIAAEKSGLILFPTH
jgi:hypothetical protein